MPLTDAAARTAKAGEKPYKMPDSKGLHLLVTPNGSKLWRMRIKKDGRETMISFGPYPEISLAKARELQLSARKTIYEGRDPVAERREAKAVKAEAADQGPDFETVAREWHASRAPYWCEGVTEDTLRAFELYVFPTMGKTPIATIRPKMLGTLIEHIKTMTTPDTTGRTIMRMSKVFEYGISKELCESDPAKIAKGQLPPLVKGRQPAIVDLDEARAAIATVEAATAAAVTKLAHRLLALTAARPGMICSLEWDDVAALDPANPVWLVTAKKMKMKRDHLVPLSRQAMEVLAVLRRLTGNGRFVFPGARSHLKPMSNNALGFLLQRSGYQGRHVPHGWRATFSTIMNERHRDDRHVIDLMLAHSPQSAVEAAYNRSLHMERRKQLAQEWADLLLEQAPPAETLMEGRHH